MIFIVLNLCGSAALFMEKVSLPACFMANEPAGTYCVLPGRVYQQL